MYVYTSESITLGTPIQLCFCLVFIVFVCMFHIYNSCDIFTKVHYQYFMYLWFVCCWRQTTGVWHTGSCKLVIALAVALFYMFRFANKGNIFPLWFCSFPVCSAVSNTHTWYVGDRNTEKGVKKTWTKYNLYSLYTLHTMQYYKAFYTFTVSTE